MAEIYGVWQLLTLIFTGFIIAGKGGRDDDDLCHGFIAHVSWFGFAVSETFYLFSR